MRRMQKHAATLVTMNDFSGGLNVMSEGDLIAPNEMQACQNFWFTGYQRSLTPRGGLTDPIATFGADIMGTYYDIDSNTFLVFLEGGAIYRYEAAGTAPDSIGFLTGTRRPVCAKFMDRIWIASGGKLQFYDFSRADSISTILNGPVCDLVFQRYSRLCAVLTGDDRVQLSAIGDGETWEEDTDDASKGAWIDVGYGDSGDIVAVAPLATDLILIKSNGMIYQLAGDHAVDSWAVYRVATETDPLGRNAALPVGNDVVFVSRQGLKTLHTTMDYGNIAQGDIGEKWNALVTDGLYDPQLFHLRRRKNLLVRPTGDKRHILAYNYAVGAATTLLFPVSVVSVEETMDRVIVAAGKNLYALDEARLSDGEGVPIPYEIQARDITSNDRILVRAVDTDFAAPQAGEVAVAVGAVRLRMPANTRRKVRCNHSARRLETRLASTTPFQPKRISLEVADL